MYSLLIIIGVLLALLLIGVVLMQESRGGGFTSYFDNFKRSFGVKKSTSFIEKTTWILAAIVVLICVVITYVIS